MPIQPDSFSTISSVQSVGGSSDYVPCNDNIAIYWILLEDHLSPYARSDIVAIYRRDLIL
jgi:hypothetical protein